MKPTVEERHYWTTDWRAPLGLAMGYKPVINPRAVRKGHTAKRRRMRQEKRKHRR